MRAISARAGLSTIGIYNHFQGKQGILDALYIEGFELLMDAIAIDEADYAPRDGVLQGLSNYIDFASARRGHYELMFGRGDPSYLPSSGAISVGAEAFNRLTKLVSRALPESLTSLEKRESALQLWALSHGYVSLQDNAATDLIPNAAWRDLMMNAVAQLLDAIIEKHAN